MTYKKRLLSHVAPVLPVVDLQTSISFYVDMLGFELKFSYGDPAYYAVLKRDEDVGIHLTTRTDDGKPSNKHNALYIFCHDVEHVFDEFTKNDVQIHSPLQTWDYGMKEFDIKDPDGYIICFGQGV